MDVKTVIENCRKTLENHCGSHLHGLFLYGSMARNQEEKIKRYRYVCFMPIRMLPNSTFLGQIHRRIHAECIEITLGTCRLDKPDQRFGQHADRHGLFYCQDLSTILRNCEILLNFFIRFNSNQTISYQQNR